MVCLKCRNLKYLTNKYWAWNTHSEKSVMLTSFCDDDILWPEEFGECRPEPSLGDSVVVFLGYNSVEERNIVFECCTLVRLEPTGQLGK